MNDIQLYEKVVKKKNSPSRILAKAFAVAGYVGFDLLWLVWILRSELTLGLIALAAISTVLLVIFTWRFFMLEYEYSFIDGELTVAKIYANRFRRVAFSADIKDAAIIAPATDENIARISHFDIESSLHAISSPDFEDIWLCLFAKKEGQKYICVYLDADERALRIFRHYNPHSTQRQTKQM